MRASYLEFRFRFFILVGTFTLAFLSYRIDPINLSVALAHLVAGPGQVASLTTVFS